MRRVHVFATIVAVLGVSPLVLAGEDVAFESLPAPVKTTVLREVKGGEILDIEKDMKRGKVVYEVEFLDGKIEWEIHVAPDGTLLKRKED